MIKSICATLLLCSFLNYDFDFKYTNKDEFVKGIIECTVHFNTAIPPSYRAIVVISVAQAILESNWGLSRFALEGNNFYGLIETDKTQPHMKALNSNIMIKKYNRKCESVADYITLLNKGSDFEEYRNERKQTTIKGDVNLDKLIDTLHTFAIDKEYTNKIKKTVDYLLREYPDMFFIVRGQNA